MLYDLLVKSYVECRHDEVGTKELMECWVKLFGLMDTAKWVSKAEWPSEVELDMRVLVEVRTQVQVEIVDWAIGPVEWRDSGLWMGP